MPEPYLAGRVVAVTGAGRGLGRAHALELAAHGAAVVVNDLGTAVDGTGADAGPAEQVCAEIAASGGRAVVCVADVSDWDGGGELVETACRTFGRLDALVLSAGNLRDRFLVNMGPDDWDEVVRVHLRGHFVPLRRAAAHWRDRSKAGEAVRASVVATTSVSGLAPNPGQANYGAAKAAIAALCQTAAAELARYGVRVNAVAPLARTRLTSSAPALAELLAPPTDPGAFDRWDPANTSPVVAWLVGQGCTATGQVFSVSGSTVGLWQPWSPGPSVSTQGRWDVGALDAGLAGLLPPPV